MAEQIGLVPTGGDQAVVLYDNDDQAITEATLTTPAEWPAPPTWNPVIAGYMDVPEVTDEDNTKEGYSIGHYDPQYLMRGRREYTIAQNIRIADPTFLLNGIRVEAASEFDGLPTFATFIGRSNYLGHGFLELYRKCVIDEMVLNFQEGSAQELTATTRIFSLGKDSSIAGIDTSAYNSPSVALLTAAGSALSWHNVLQVMIGADGYRDVIQDLKITINNNVEHKGCRPIVAANASQAAKDLAFCAERFLPRTRRVKVDLTLHNVLPATLYENFAIGNIVITAKPGFSTYASDAKTWTVTIPTNAFKSSTQRGVEPGAQMSFTADLVSSGISSTYA